MRTVSVSDRRLTVTVEDGYVKAYAHRIDADGNEAMVGYGLQGREREQVSEGVRLLVDEFLADTIPESAIVRKRAASSQEPS
jgi:hypothetical protein